MGMRDKQTSRVKAVVFFAAPLCNQMAASVMSGLKKLGVATYSNQKWCCASSESVRDDCSTPTVWNWCKFLPDQDLLEMAGRPGVLSIGTVRYESANYWEHDGDATEICNAAEVQLEAITRGLIDLYIDDGDYGHVYKQLDSVQLYVKREPTRRRTVRTMTLGLCPWLPTVAPAVQRDLFLSVCFPYEFRKKWDRLNTMKVLSRAIKHIPDIWIGPVEEALRDARYVATGNRQGEAYLNILRRSCASLSLPGQGWDTYRFWEILSCGSCLLSPRAVVRELPISPPPRDGCEYFGFDNDEELLELIFSHYDHRERLRYIATAGQNWAIRYHSDVNRAKQILDLVSSRL